MVKRPPATESLITATGRRSRASKKAADPLDPAIPEPRALEDFDPAYLGSLMEQIAAAQAERVLRDSIIEGLRKATIELEESPELDDLAQEVKSLADEVQNRAATLAQRAMQVRESVQRLNHIGQCIVRDLRIGRIELPRRRALAESIRRKIEQRRARTPIAFADPFPRQPPRQIPTCQTFADSRKGDVDHYKLLLEDRRRQIEQLRIAAELARRPWCRPPIESDGHGIVAPPEGHEQVNAFLARVRDVCSTTVATLPLCAAIVELPAMREACAQEEAILSTLISKRDELQQQYHRAEITLKNAQAALQIPREVLLSDMLEQAIGKLHSRQKKSLA